MSGQWEVVGKKKNKEKIFNKQNVTESKKNNVTQGPKIEEVLNPLQIKNLYAPKKTKEDTKVIEKPKQEKKQAKKIEKSAESTKSKPKSMENALKSINIEELQNLFENNKKLFPESPLIWLKEISQFLNQKLHVDVQDHVFSNKPDNYPFSAMPLPLKNVIETAIKQVGKSLAQTFYGVALTSMATDMGKGLPVMGYKLILQYLAAFDSKIVIVSLNKYKELKNSYQNQQSIGLSILWALGQSGNKDFESGIKVFQEIMLPMIEMKNYSRYITKYLIDLINKHHSNTSISKEDYLLVLDIVFANYKNFPSDYRSSMNKIVPLIKEMLLNNSKNENINTIFEPLLKKILSNSNSAYRKEICDILVSFLIKDPNLFNSWKKVYPKNVQNSAYFLKYIDENWKKISHLLHKQKFVNFLDSLAEANNELKESKKKVEGLNDCITVIQCLKKKMIFKSKSTVSYNFLSFFVFLTFGSILFYDIRLNGCWYDSATYKGLKNSGSIYYFNKATELGLQGILWSHEKLEAQFPGYYERIHEVSKPYFELLEGLGLVVRNIAINIKDEIALQIPHVTNYIDFYAPGLLEKSKNIIYDAWLMSALYVNNFIQYLKTNVFVGNLSPENVQSVLIDAINTTQEKAIEYYHWVYDKVQTSIK